MVQNMMHINLSFVNNPMLQQSLDMLKSNPKIVSQFLQMMSNPNVWNQMSSMMTGVGTVNGGMVKQYI